MASGRAKVSRAGLSLVVVTMKRLWIGLGALVAAYYAMDRWLEYRFYSGKHY